MASCAAEAAAADGAYPGRLGRGGSFAVWICVSRELWCCRTRGCACGGLGRSHETHSRRLSSFRKPHAHVQSPRGGRRACLGLPPKPTRGSRGSRSRLRLRERSRRKRSSRRSCVRSVHRPSASLLLRGRSRVATMGSDVVAFVTWLARIDLRVGRGGSTSRVGPLARVVYAGKHLCGDRERDRRVQSLSRIALGLETRGASHPAPRVAL